MNVRHWALRETLRQQAALSSAPRLERAYRLAAANPSKLRSVSGLVEVHQIFEPEHAGLRRVPAVFHQGPPAVDHREVPGALDRLLRFYDEADDDEWVKSFLDIHPFADGNGRMASIIYNVRKGNGENPVQLPYYYGNK